MTQHKSAPMIALLAAIAPLEAVDAAAQGEASTANLKLAALDISGSTIEPALRRAAAPYLGRPASTEQLQALAKALDAAYGRSDGAIYTIDLRSISQQGTLFVGVREGRVERLRFSGVTTGVGARVRELAGRLEQADGPLSRRRLHRVLQLVQAIPGGRVEAFLNAGTKPGGLEIHFQTQADPNRLALQFNNNGQAFTGRAQMQLIGQGNSIVRPGDQLGVLLGRNLNGRIRMTAAAYSLPVGADGAVLDLAAASSASDIAEYRLRGDAYGLSAAVTYPLLLTERDLLSATATIAVQGNESRFAGYRLFRERTPAARLSLRWRRETGRTASSVQLTGSHSLPFAQVEVSAPTADRHFSKWEAQIAHDRLIGRTVALRTRLWGQYSPDALTQAEAAVLGGDEFGQAYDAAILIGDSALAGRVEAAWGPPAKSGRRVELFAAADAARAYYNERLLYNSGHFDLASLGGGVRVQEGALSTNLSVHRALVSPYQGYEKGWRALVNVSFSFP